MLDVVFHIALIVAWAAYAAVQVVYYVHMLQLNSYRPERYWKWCGQNKGKLLSLIHI